MSTASTDRGRITTRVPQKVQETLELAASIVGATTNQFIVQAALHEAERIIAQEKFVHLSKQDTESFFNALDNPPAPNQKLLATIKEFTERYNAQTSTFNWEPQQKRV